MKNIYLLSNQTKTVVSPRTVGVSLPSRCRVLPIILLFLAVFSLHAWGDAAIAYTLNGTTTGGTNNYAAASDITQGTKSWKVVANTTENPWRIGGKSISGVDRNIYSTDTISNHDIDSVVINHGGTGGSITVNSITLTVSKNEDFSSPISTLSVTSSPFVANDSLIFRRPVGKDWSKCYFKITYNVTVSSGSNKYIQFKNAKFYKTVSTACTNTVTITKGAETNGTYTLSATSICGDVPGGTVNISAITPADGFEFDEITTSASGTVDNTNKRVTGITANTTITVKFKPLPTYAIRFFNNGVQVGSTQNIVSGGTATPPSDPTGCAEFTFLGWWTSELADDNTTSYTWVTDFTVTGNQDYYAVYSHPSPTSSIITLDPTTDTSFPKDGITLTTSNGVLNNGTDYRIYKGATLTITSSVGNMTNIAFTFDGSYNGGGWTTSYTPNSSSWTSPACTSGDAGKQARITNLVVTVGVTYYTSTADCRSCYEPTLAFGVTEVNKFVGDANFTYTATPASNPMGGTVSYSSNKPTKASVDPSTGEVTILDAMSDAPITITATLGAVDDGVHCQKKVTATYTLNIYNRVTWLVNGAAYTAGDPTPQAAEGGTITAYPTDPDGATACGGKTFVGWTTAPYAESDAAPDPLYTSLSSMSSVHITENTTFHAVFAEVTSGGPNKFKRITTDAGLVRAAGTKIAIISNNASKILQNDFSVVDAPTPDGDGIITVTDNQIWTLTEEDEYHYWSLLSGSVQLGVAATSGYSSGFYECGNYSTEASYWHITYTSEFSGTENCFYLYNWSNGTWYDGLEFYGGTTNKWESVYFASANSNFKNYCAMQIYGPYASYAAYSTTCGPNIKAGEVEYLTSTKDQTVKSQAITIKGSSLTGGTLSVKSITGDASQFACVLASQTITAGAIETTYTITYTPTVYDAAHTAEIIFSDGTTESDPITLRGRSLPQQFAIVAFDGANYYALNGSMSGLASMVKPLPVTVTAGAVDLCPNQAIYSLTERETPDKNVYLVGPGADGSGARLWGGSDTKLNTKSLTSTNQTGWLLTTSDFSTYHITNADVTTRGIMYYSTSDAFGHYATAQYGTANYYGDIQLLPITEVCTCLPAPFPTAVARATSVTITWGEVTGAVSYVVTCSGGSAPVYDGCKATITGLTNNTNYTYTVKAVASGTDCSLIYNGNFTTVDCDDVPYAISVAPALTSATFRWSMEAASATIRIYSDEECTAQVGSDHTGLTSPATITGLDENTTYYAKIWAGGTCVSAVTSFTTNSPSVELAEWFPDSIRIVLNADTANATVVIEDKDERVKGATSLAEDIFFSKYYEAAGYTKLVGLYNGTDHDIDLSDLKIIGGTSAWSSSTSDHNYVVLKDVSKLVTDYGDGAGHIYLPQGKEIILYSLDDDNSSTGDHPFPGDGCLDKFYDWDDLANNDVDGWYRIGNLSAGADGDGHTTFNFSGPYSIGLKRGSKLIDLIGAGNVSAPNKSATVKVTTSKTLGNGRVVATPNDKEGFWYEDGWSPKPMEGDADYTTYPDGYSTYLSTNRCLLIRANHVVSGDSAVLNNTTTFKTLGDYTGVDSNPHKGEWVGIPVGKNDDGTTDYCFSGQQFGYVGSYDYNAYYAKYDSIADLKELGGSQNPDGTYTIKIPHLDTLSCTSLKVNVYEGSVVQASKTYQVPIMVTTEKAGGWSTTDTIFQNKWHDLEACEKCDVVILKGATLTKAENGLPKDAATVGNLTIYPGGTMNIPTSRTFNVASVQFRVEGENVPFIKLAGTLETADRQVLVSRRIDNSDAYFFSLPYDCNISDIRWSNGVPAILDDGFRIKEYDSRARADEGSTKGAPGHWKMVTGSTLEAGKGYQISVNNRYLRELIFPLDLGKTNVSDAENEKNSHGDNVVPIHQYTNGATTINNHNWNFIAQPYLCAMTPMAGDAITYGYLEYEIEEVAGEQQVVWYRRMEGNQYLTIYNPSTRTYDQKFWSSVTQLDPFLAFFVQGKTEGSFTFTEGNRKNSAPARHLASQAEVDDDPSIFVGVTLSGNGLTDQANLRVRQDFTEDEYKLGYDLLKFTTYYKDRPQVYMKTPSYQLAFQAVSDSVAKNTWLPMGVYCYKPGTYTFGLSNDYPIDEVEAVYLYDKVAGVTTNLLYDTYTITTSSQLYTNTRFALNVIVNRREPQVTTDTGLPEAPDNMVRKILINGHVYIQRGAAIYDITGKQMLNF